MRVCQLTCLPTTALFCSRRTAACVCLAPHAAKLWSELFFQGQEADLLFHHWSVAPVYAEWMLLDARDTFIATCSKQSGLLPSMGCCLLRSSATLSADNCALGKLLWQGCILKWAKDALDPCRLCWSTVKTLLNMQAFNVSR